MPLCAFAHYCTTILNGSLIDVKQSVNREGKLSMVEEVRLYIDYIVPEPIGEYLSLLYATKTQAGDELRLNIPDVAVP